MKFLMSLTVFGIMSSCNLLFAQQQYTQQFQWLAGTWQNIKTGEFEHWDFDTAGNKMVGFSFSMAGNDTTITERMEVIAEEENYFFVADVPQNPSLVAFKVVQYDENSFRCENPQHDFPQFINYILLAPDTLSAEIGNETRTIRFDFVKVGEKKGEEK